MERVHLKNLATNLNHHIRRVIQKRQSHLREHASLLDSFSPLRTVARGYSIVTEHGGRLIKSAGKLSLNQSVHITFAEGSADATITQINIESKKE